jgi:uncharacterized protein YbjT (DUF2867 family)
MGKTALIIGATGLIGKKLTEQLFNDPYYEVVRIFVRRPGGFSHPKLEEFVIDFDQPETWKSKVTGDVLFSTLGTTIKTAKTQANQYKVDFTYQYEFARAASENKVPNYVLVSSAGADPQSRLFYSRMKGDLEEAVKKLPFRKIVIMQPSLLDGERQEKRPAEKISLSIARSLTKIVFRKYRPAKAEVVARAMIKSVSDHSLPARQVFTLNEVLDYAAR